jgi:hypothetical protein
MELTKHASRRAAQRSVPEGVIAAIYVYGASYSTRGCTGLRLDRTSIELAANDLSPQELERLRRFHDVYLVTSGSKVVTVARATSRRFH